MAKTYTTYIKNICGWDVHSRRDLTGCNHRIIEMLYSGQMYVGEVINNARLSIELMRGGLQDSCVYYTLTTRYPVRHFDTSSTMDTVGNTYFSKKFPTYAEAECFVQTYHEIVLPPARALATGLSNIIIGIEKLLTYQPVVVGHGDQKIL